MQRAIIVDLDATLADNGHRTMYVDGSQQKDWNAFNALSAFDPHNEWCREIVMAFHAMGYKIIFLTARSGTESTKKITLEWLTNHIGVHVPYELIMRDEKDFRPDYVTKQDLYTMKVAPYYEVLFAIDDKKIVVDMWRELGITALHCSN